MSRESQEISHWIKPVLKDGCWYSARSPRWLIAHLADSSTPVGALTRYWFQGLAIAIPGPTLPYLERRVHATTQTISYIFTARSLGYILGEWVHPYPIYSVSECIRTLYTLWVSASVPYILCECIRTLYTLWVSASVPYILCEWVHPYPIYSVSECIRTLYTLWVSASVPYILCEWVHPYPIYSVSECIRTL